MGSDADADAAIIDELPSPPPVKATYKPFESTQRAAALFPSAGHRDKCMTPTSEKHRLKPATVCPPAPIKRKPAKRTADVSPPAPQPKEFLAVPRDLTSIFIALPPEKRIRVV